MNHATILIAAIAAAGLCSCKNPQGSTDVIYQCDKYTVYADSVVQGPYRARALGPGHIETSYRSPVDAGSSPEVKFRFSLNSRDNELPLGQSHEAVITPGDTTVCTFGQVLRQAEQKARLHELPKDARWTLRVDMRPVLREFAKHGRYVTAQGDTIYADDFKGVWLAGSVEPLTWDFENLHGKDDRKLTAVSGKKFQPTPPKKKEQAQPAKPPMLKSKARGAKLKEMTQKAVEEPQGTLDDSIYQVTLTVNPTRQLRPDRERWQVSQGRLDSLQSRYGAYTSGQKLVDAAFNMALDEIDQNTVTHGEFAGTFRTGAEWEGVWTRDVSYSIILSLGVLDPETSMASLRRKVKNGRIVQDTGTGGAWPVSSDRVCWGVAAWELYKITGDRKWLAEARQVLANTLDDDMHVVYDPHFKLMHGEQSYLDWREQTYPRWMQPADIYSSMCLGTNVVFAQAYEVLGDMEEALGLPFAQSKESAAALRGAINDRLWIPELGRYGQYLYGSFYPILSQSADNLGQALSVIYGVATPEMARSLVAKTPVCDFGTSSVYPQLPDIQPYHNDAVWPFVQAFWNLAAAKTRNQDALLAGMGALWRAAALFATNKELYVTSTGDFRGTAVNSDAQLWSCAGNAAMVLRVLLGMEFLPTGIEFHPVIPEQLSGTRTLKGLRYRDATLDITVHGHGTKVASLLIDSVSPGEQRLVPATLKGRHSVDITMANDRFPAAEVNAANQEWMPATPIVKWNGLKAHIENFQPGLSYCVYVNGVMLEEIQTADYELVPQSPFSLLAFTPVRDQHYVGFTMRPLQHLGNPADQITIQAETLAQGGTSLIRDPEKAARFVELTTQRNTTLDFTVDAPATGEYFVDVRYANGSGPVNTDSKCGLRTLMVAGEAAGPLVMPQRGVDEWLSTGFSNPVRVRLNKGENQMSIRYLTPQNINMDSRVNTVLIDYVRIIRK